MVVIHGISRDIYTSINIINVIYPGRESIHVGDVKERKEKRKAIVS